MIKYCVVIRLAGTCNYKHKHTSPKQTHNASARVCVCKCMCVWFVLVSFFLRLRLLFGIVWPTYLSTYPFPVLPSPPFLLIRLHLLLLLLLGFCFGFLSLLFDFFYLFCAPSRNLKLISFQVMFTFFSSLFFWNTFLLSLALNAIALLCCCRLCFMGQYMDIFGLSVPISVVFDKRNCVVCAYRLNLVQSVKSALRLQQK